MRNNVDPKCRWCARARDVRRGTEGDSVSENMRRLRDLLAAERDSDLWGDCAETDAALAAVEQEIAKLKEELDEEIDHNARLSAKLDETKHNCACDYDERGAVCLVHARPVREARERIAALEKDRDHCQRLYLEACESGSGHARIAALEAELVELRKRPTLEEVLAEMDKVPDKPGLNFGVAACVMKVTGLYARKAGA